MKPILKILLIIIPFIVNFRLSAQVVGKFGVNQSTLNTNAVLEIESISKGVLLPRLTTVQQNAMSSPPDGMLIYNTDSACFVLRRAGVWRSLCAANGGEAWSTLGNAGTNANTNFLGTTDYKDLVFRTNNTEKARLTADGYWGLGSTNPVSRMHVINPSGWDSGNDYVFDDYSSGTTGSTIYLRRARGTQATPLSVATGDTLGRLAFDPYQSGAFSYSGGTHISSVYRGNGTNSKTNFMVSTSNMERMVIDENGNTGLGIATPQYKLDIDAQTGSAGNPLRLLGLNVGATSDSILSSASGVLRRLSINQVIANAWNITGNASTVDGTNFLGTTDNIPLSMRVNNIQSARIDHLKYNAFFGFKAGLNNTSGVNNVFIADSAGFTNTTGFQNTFIGNQSGFSNTTGYINQFIGDGAGFGNTTGWRNTAIGHQAGYYLSTGAGNILMGRYAGFSDVTNKLTGDKNVAIGDEAGKFITTGYQNAFLADDAGFNTTTGYLNTAIGQSALYTNTTGNSNVAIGTSAGRSVTTSENVFLGSNTGYNTSSGTKNAFVGYAAGTNTTTGSQNTFLGYRAGFGNITATGSDNVYIGYDAGYNFTSNTTNVGVGREALFNSIGNGNIGLGYQAGLIITSGSNNTFLGNSATASSATLTNATAIGNGATVNASNKIRLGNSAVTLVETQGSFVTVSDKRLKTNINENLIGLDFIKAVRPVHYELKAQKGIVYDGFIAQEVDSILQKQGIKSFSGVVKPSNTEGGYYTVSYATFVVPLVNAVKELDAKSEKLKMKNEKLVADNEQLKIELEKLKKDNTTLRANVEKNSQDIELIKAALNRKQN